MDEQLMAMLYQLAGLTIEMQTLAQALVASMQPAWRRSPMRMLRGSRARSCSWRDFQLGFIENAPEACRFQTANEWRGGAWRTRTFGKAQAWATACLSAQSAWGA